jgi:hypothetical protein
MRGFVYDRERGRYVIVSLQSGCAQYANADIPVVQRVIRARNGNNAIAQIPTDAMQAYGIKSFNHPNSLFRVRLASFERCSITDWQVKHQAGNIAALASRSIDHEYGVLKACVNCGSQPPNQAPDHTQ